MVTGEESRFLILFLAGTFAFFLIAAAFILFHFKSVRRIHQKQLLLEKARAEHQQELLKSAIQVEEKERRRFSRDLHDEAGALLAGVRLKINLIEKESADAGRVERLSSEAKEMLDHTIRSVRNISHNLLPPSLETFGLQGCLESFFRDLNTSIEADLRFETVRERLPQDVEIAVYRVVSELCGNTLKHAGADNISLEITISANLLRAVYRDNGKGIDPLKVNAAAGLGMKNMESRVSMLGGKIALGSHENKGMEAVIEIPL